MKAFKTSRRQFLQSSAALAGCASYSAAMNAGGLISAAFPTRSGSDPSASDSPKMLCYSVQPNGYLNDHATEIKKMYDGFFFTVGSWEQFAQRFVGVHGVPPEQSQWVEAARRNLTALRAAGVTENFLDVAFEQDGAWPSGQDLLNESFTEIMAAQFSAIGRLARELGFRGVAIDVEYPYKRYLLTNPVYNYEDYTAGDIVRAAFKQGQRSMAALLDAFPEAVVLVLPGTLRSAPVVRLYMLGMLNVMASRNAPGGFQLATEYTYCLADPVSTLATTRFEDVAIPLLADHETVDYWNRRCSMAPGVWPLHLVETGAKGYPVQPWKDEVRQLREQMAILRTTTKRYIWSFSANPVWYIWSPELGEKYGLPKQNLLRSDINLRDWQQILIERPVLPSDSPLAPIVKSIKKFDQGQLSAAGLCDAFGTPGQWWVLGILGNVHTVPQFAATEALSQPIDTYTPYQGRDQVVRWFAFDNFDPRAITDCRYVFDWRGTDNGAAHFVTFVESPEKRQAFLHVGWDDYVSIRLGNQVVFESPVWGGFALYRDKYRFARRVPITLNKGKAKLAINCANALGSWLFSLRITDEHGVPFTDVHFTP